jgi:putative restriction endonuclease
VPPGDDDNDDLPFGLYERPRPCRGPCHAGASHRRRGRVTKVDEPRHLKASHIKPWRDATDTERLDGANGLLLSPHIDHLFDDGYITFSPNQELVIVPEVREKLLDAWGIDAGVRVGDFSREQNAYLDDHRANVFKRELLS